MANKPIIGKQTLEIANVSKMQMFLKLYTLHKKA